MLKYDLTFSRLRSALCQVTTWFKEQASWCFWLKPNLRRLFLQITIKSSNQFVGCKFCFLKSDWLGSTWKACPVRLHCGQISANPILRAYCLDGFDLDVDPWEPSCHLGVPATDRGRRDCPQLGVGRLQGERQAAHGRVQVVHRRTEGSHLLHFRQVESVFGTHPFTADYG